MSNTNSVKSSIIVGMADLKIAKAPDELVTNLGSCIGLCVYDTSKKVGGMLHLMLASSGNAKEKEGFKAAKYADTGIPEMLSQLKKSYSVDPKSLSAKIFGGGRILKNMTSDIGLNNEEAVKAILSQYGVKIVAQKTGGEKGYRIKFDLSTGVVSCQIFGEPITEH